MTWRPLALAFVIALGAWVHGFQQGPPTFRRSVDVIAVDVAVIDRDGRPFTGLRPDQFAVSLGGRKRRVVSADFVDYRERDTALVSGRAALAPPAAAASPELDRVFMIAIDCLSFSPEVTRHVAAAAQGFVRQLLPRDVVGLYAYPQGPQIDPSMDHSAVTLALNRVMGQRGGALVDQFNLRPSEIVDLARWARGVQPVDAETQGIVDSRCARDDLSCLSLLKDDIGTRELAAEVEGGTSLNMLQSLMRALKTVPGRKTVVLVSAGLLASDRPGGRPDLGEIGGQVGRAAAESDVRIYTLFIDSAMSGQGSAEVRRGVLRLENRARDRDVMERSLNRLTGESGGALTRVAIGSGESTFDRIITETSAYYLLGVEPEESDRDGRLRDLSVKVSQKGTSVLNRKWVMVPRRSAAGASPGAMPAALPAPVVTAPLTIVPSTPASRASAPAPSRALAALFTAFERGEFAAVETGLRMQQGLWRMIAEFREAANPWQGAPRREAVFALELAAAGLLSDDDASRDEASTLLVRYNSVVRQPLGLDAFECEWYRAEVALLQGSMRPATAQPLVDLAIARCPREPRFLLARAVVADQAWTVASGSGSVPDARMPAGSPPVSDLVARYEAAALDPETAVEARVREAWVLFRAGQVDAAGRVLQDVPAVPADPDVRYYSHLVRGQVLRAAGQFDAAEAAFRAALAVSPGAPSAQTALMTLLFAHGDRRAGEAIAEQIQSAPAGIVDPWWQYPHGDFRVYGRSLATLHAGLR